jgi:hypothetical protein
VAFNDITCSTVDDFHFVPRHQRSFASCLFSLEESVALQKWRSSGGTDHANLKQLCPLLVLRPPHSTASASFRVPSGKGRKPTDATPAPTTSLLACTGGADPAACLRGGSYLWRCSATSKLRHKASTKRQGRGGVNGDAFGEAANGISGIPVLSKPFRVAELSRRIAEILNGSSSGDSARGRRDLY